MNNRIILKAILTILTLVLSHNICEAQTKRTIHVATAGTLPELISEDDKYQITDLTLTGEINGDDLGFLREMAGLSMNAESDFGLSSIHKAVFNVTDGKLTNLDLSGVRIVAGGCYMRTFGDISWYGYLKGDDQIPSWLFYECSGLTSVTIPNSVISIGESAFSGCSGLTYVAIPNSVTFIGQSAFSGCSGLTSITIPNSVTSIGLVAFSGCSGLTSVAIPNSVTKIELGAFSGCSGLTSVTIPNSVTSIGGSTFSGCSGLTSITIPNSVKSIGWKAFEGTAWYNNQSDGLVYAGKVLYRYKGEMPANSIITIDSGTLGISDDAFAECSGLISVTIPNSVTSIGSSAFYSCSGLTSITIPNSVTSIGGGAFSGCRGLISITIPNSVNSIGSGAFEGTAWYDNQSDGLVYAGKVLYRYKGEMPANTILTLDRGTLGIAGKAFNDCSGLTSITIPDSVTSIGGSAFSGCSGLTSITLPNSVTSIEDDAFAECSGLISVTIPNSVTSIGSSAFYSCSGLTSVTIPNSVTSIGSRAFYYCGLTTVISEIEHPFAIDEETFLPDFYTVYPTATLTVPAGTKAKYQATDGWYKFTNIVEAPEKDEFEFTITGLTYQGSKSEKTTLVKSVDPSITSVEIPISVIYDGTTYKITGIDDHAFDGCKMAALVWNAEFALPSKVISNAGINSNFLLYVQSDSYAPSSVKNVVVNNSASSITLSDDGGPFYCPKAFTANSISYSHNYNMETGGDGMGWETIALPFDVQKINHSRRGDIVPFASYSNGSIQKPFWLASMSSNGFIRASAIKANTPYIIAMPNSSKYQNDYNLSGDVTFSSADAYITKTPTFSGTFVPAYSTVEKSSNVYALNVKNRYVSYSGNYDAGSRFISNLRDVRPFEAYISESSTRGIIEIGSGDGTTGMPDVIGVYDADRLIDIYTLSGQKVAQLRQGDLDNVLNQLPHGVYIVNGKKIVK